MVESPWTMGNMRVAFLWEPAAESGAMKTLQVACIVGAIAFTGIIYLVGGNGPVATVPDALPEAAVNAATPGAPALAAVVPEASAGSATALAAEPGSVTSAVSGPLMA